jgi:TPR repeat protein
MGKGRIFVIGFCAALLWGPRTGGTGEAGTPRASTPTQLAMRTDGSLGVWSNFDDAVGWIRARAARGDAGAQYELAHLQFVGLLPQRDAGETLRLLTASAEAGHDQAQLLLGRVREFGFEDARPDLVQALKWYARVAARGGAVDLRMAAVEACARLRPRLSVQALVEAETLAALGRSGGR